MSPRLAAHVEVGALIRRVNAAGGFAAVIAKGDAEAGGLLLLLVSHDRSTRAVQRVLDQRGDYGWRESFAAGPDESTQLQDYLDRQRRYDPDLWIVELDVADAERFIDDDPRGD